MLTIRSACTYDCPDACALLIETQGDQKKLKGDPKHPITRGFLCKRIKKHLRRLEHPERLTSPRVRKDDRWFDIGWDLALALAAEKLGLALNQDGPQSVLFLQGGGSLGLSKELVRHFFFSLGPITTTRGGPCGEAGEAAQILDFGDSADHDYSDTQNSQAIVLWGKNPTATGVHFVPFLRQAQKRGVPVVLIEVRPTETTGLADRVIKVAPSGDGFLALAVLRLLYDRGLLNEEACQRAENFDEFREWIASDELDVDTCAAKAGDVPLADIEFLADLYAHHQPVATWVGWGLQRRVSGGRNLRCIDALGLLSGNVGRPGGGVNFTSIRKRGLDRSFLAHSFQQPGRMIDSAFFGPQLAELDQPKIRFAYIAFANPVTQLSQSTSISSAFRKDVEFTVVADSFFTDTAQASDLILPVSMMLEEDDIVGSYQHHHLAVARKAVEPPEGVRSDLWIVGALNRGLGRPDDPVLEEPGRALERMTAPWFEGHKPEIRRNPCQEEIPFQDSFPTASGKAQLFTKMPTTPKKSKEYPFVLLSPSCRMWQTSWLFEEEQRDQIALCSVNPEAPGIDGVFSDNDRARLESPVGSLDVRLCFEPRLGRHECVVRRGGWSRHGLGVNNLIECQTTDYGDGVAFYDQKVRITKA